MRSVFAKRSKKSRWQLAPAFMSDSWSPSRVRGARLCNGLFLLSHAVYSKLWFTSKISWTGRLLGQHLLLAKHFLRHAEVGQEVHEGLQTQKWSLSTLGYTCLYCLKILCRMCLLVCVWCCVCGFVWHRAHKVCNWSQSYAPPAWIGGGHALAASRHNTWFTMSYSSKVCLASAGDIVFNLIKRIFRIDQVMEFQVLTFQSMRSLKSTLLLSSWAAWSLRVSEAHRRFHVLVSSGTRGTVPFALLGGTDTSCGSETASACS